jgi:hypothetical protein
MMKRQKLSWTLMLLLLLLLILGLAACGGQGDEAPSVKAAEGTEIEAPNRSEGAIEIRQATTVMAATRMIDLHALPLPDEAELMGQSEPGSLSYQAPIEVAEAVELYRSALIDQGWQESTESGNYIFFTKANFTLSLSASEMGEEKTMISLTNHGNVDLRALPQMADAEDVYYLPSTLNYFSPTDVAGVADFTRRELAAMGWHEYTRPHTDMANDPERENLTFIQNGLELSVSVGMAPAQGGKTAVQYSVSLLPLDLPLPAEAAGVELDKFLLSLSLSFATPADFETLLDYYSQEMTALGWVVIDDLGMMTPERATLFFGNENVPPHTLVLDLVPFDGQTLATLRNYDVDEITELNTSSDGDSVEITADDSTATEIEANVGDTIEMGNLSFTVTEVTSPEDMAYPPQEDNKFLQIVFTVENKHTSDTFDAFYSLWLSIEGSNIWSYSYDELGFTTVGDSDDSYGSHNGQIEPGEQAQGRVIFQVPVDAEGLVFVFETPDLEDDKALVTLPETEAPPTAGSAPDASAADIPAFLAPPNAQNLAYDADYGDITYTSPSDVETVVEFYRQSLPVEGWQEDEDFSAVSKDFAFVSFDQDDDTLFIDVTFIDTGITEVTIDVSLASSLAATMEGKPSTETTASAPGPLSLVEAEGFPVSSDYTGLGTMGTPFALMVTFSSPSDVDTLVELYETEMPGQGWEFIGYSMGGEIAHLYFESGDQKLSIDLRVNSGEFSPDLAGQTAVN